MKIVIVGDGKIGRELTRQLSREGHDIVIVDANENVLEQSLETYDVMVVHGNGASMDVLRQADIESADLLIAATSSDETNLLSCIVAKKMTGVQTIARVRNPEYSKQLLFLKDELGLSMTINPEFTAAREINQLLQFPSFLKRDTFAQGKVEIVEIKITPNSELCDTPLSKLYESAKVRVLVCAVERQEEVIIPDGNFRLRAGDNIYVTASTSDLASLIKHLGLQKQKIRSVMIIGGSRTAHYLALRLLHSGMSVKIIEQNPQRCLHLAEVLPKAVIINEDGTQQSILQAEGIQKTDAVITMTNIDEENMIISMFANHIGVPKVITKINRMEYIDSFRNMGMDCVISPKILCSAEVVRYVRAMANTTDDSVLALHKLIHEKVEALEFRASESTRYINTPLSDVPLQPGILIASITHRGRIAIPTGTDRFYPGDTVIVITTSERTLSELNEIFLD